MRFQKLIVLVLVATLGLGGCASNGSSCGSCRRGPDPKLVVGALVVAGVIAGAIALSNRGGGDCGNNTTFCGR